MSNVIIKGYHVKHNLTLNKDIDIKNLLLKAKKVADYAVKNKEPVTITYKQSGNKILNSQSGSSVMVGGRSADGLFLITRARDNMGYYIVGTNSDSEMSEDLIWGCGKRTHVVTYKGAYGPMTIKISPK